MSLLLLLSHDGIEVIDTGGGRDVFIVWADSEARTFFPWVEEVEVTPLEARVLPDLVAAGATIYPLDSEALHEALEAVVIPDSLDSRAIVQTQDEAESEEAENRVLHQGSDETEDEDSEARVVVWG